MTIHEFAVLCGEKNLIPELVLENKKILIKIRERDWEEVKKLMESEF